MRPHPFALALTTLFLSCTCTAVLLALLAPAPARAARPAAPAKPADKPKPPDEPMVLKFLGAQKSRVGGREVLVIGGADPNTGKTLQFPVPNNDPKSNKYDPKTDLAEKIEQYKPGDYVKVKVQGNYNDRWLEYIERYDMKEGEELPGNYVFYETYSDVRTTPPVQVVRVQKFGQTGEFVVPMKPNEKKQMEPDPAIVAAADKYKKGDIVSIEPGPGNPPTIRSIDLYRAPEEAKLGKVIDAEVAGGQKGPAVELDQNGKTVTLPIKGKLHNKKWQADGQLLSRAKSLRPGTAVLFSTHEEEGKTYLKDLKAAPATPAATPAKTGSKRFDK